MTSGQRLYAVYEKLLDSVLNDEGYGGPVAHTATVDGYRLRVATSDFGELLVSGRKNDRIFGFEAIDGPDGVEWTPVYTPTLDSDLDLLADLCGRAVWTDTIQRTNASARKDGPNG